jgi:hypothetical protein
MPQGSTAVLVLALVAFASASCARLERAHECLSLADEINPILARIEHLATPTPSAERLRKLAILYRDLAARVKAAPASNADLAPALDGYREVLLETASTLETLAGANSAPAQARKKSKSKGRSPAALAGVAQLETVRRREEIQVERINRLCQRL